MVPKSLLLVLVVGEAGLRSTLVARLSIAGAEVLTTDDPGDPGLTRLAGRRLVLIADQAALDSPNGGLERLSADPRWSRLVLVSRDGRAGNDDPRLIRLDRAGAAAAIGALLPEWEDLP